MTDILSLSAIELSTKIKHKELTTFDAIHAVFQRIEEQEKKLHCYITLLSKDVVLERAKKIQEAIDKGELDGPLVGVPIAIKDNLCTKGILTTAGSRMLDGFIPPYSSTVVERVEEAGMILLGKTNMDEFGMGSTTESSAYGLTRNPHNLMHSPGGSSGGSAAAVASGEAFIALGSDTGGSIRQPASYCGVIGMKPSYGMVSRYGLIAYASSFDQVGPIGKTVEDCKALLSIIAGGDEKDATVVSIPRFPFAPKGPMNLSPSPSPSTETGFEKDTKNHIPTLDNPKFEKEAFRFGIPMDLLAGSTVVECFRSPFSLDSMCSILQKSTVLSDSVKECFITNLQTLSTQKIELIPFKIGMVDFLLPTYYIIACAQASSNLARYDGVKYGHRARNASTIHELYNKTRREGFGNEVKKRILLGTYTLSEGFYDAYYKKALMAKDKISERIRLCMQNFDAIILPTSPFLPPRLSFYQDDAVAMYESDLLTVFANLCELPAISLPARKASDGLPIGLQLVGKQWEDERLLSISTAVEEMLSSFPSL